MSIQELLIDDFEDIWNYKLPWGTLNEVNIMVTGASGLIGSFFIRALLDRNMRYGGGQYTHRSAGEESGEASRKVWKFFRSGDSGTGCM